MEVRHLDADELIARLDAALPQTQCAQCGYPGCLPYAEAIAANTAPINRCPPGGTATLAVLAALMRQHMGQPMDQPLPALDASCGGPGPLQVAVIDEARCIGCTLCIDACPVDAIIGATRRMHSVLPDLCSGCELCVAPCPVDCISMVRAARDWTPADAAAARTRHRSRNDRVARGERIADRVVAATSGRAARQAAVAAAFARARSRRAKVGDAR